MKELGMKWLASLYDKLQREKTIIIKWIQECWNCGWSEGPKLLSSDEDDIDPFQHLNSDVNSDHKDSEY